MHCIIIQLEMLFSVNVPFEVYVHASMFSLAPLLTAPVSIRRCST